MGDAYSTALAFIVIIVGGAIGVRTRNAFSPFEVVAASILVYLLRASLLSRLDFPGTLGDQFLTLLAGAEIEFVLLKSKAREDVTMSGHGFAVPGLFRRLRDGSAVIYSSL